MSIQCPNCKASIEIRVVSAAKPSFIDKPSESGKDMDDVGSLLHGIDMDSLNDYEKEFVENTRERYEKYHSKIQMSDKQMGVLREIASKGF